MSTSRSGWMVSSQFSILDYLIFSSKVPVGCMQKQTDCSVWLRGRHFHTLSSFSELNSSKVTPCSQAQLFNNLYLWWLDLPQAVHTLCLAVNGIKQKPAPTGCHHLTPSQTRPHLPCSHAAVVVCCHPSDGQTHSGLLANLVARIPFKCTEVVVWSLQVNRGKEQSEDQLHATHKL